MLMGILILWVPVEQPPGAQMWQVRKLSAGGQDTFVVEDGQRKMKSAFPPLQRCLHVDTNYSLLP